MRRLRFYELVLLPLLFVWIIFQISHLNNSDKEFDLKYLNLTSLLKSDQDPTVKDRKWMPPDDYDGSYDNEFFEFLKPHETQSDDVLPKKLWFMEGGDVRPEHIKVDLEQSLWPEQDCRDRIVEQLMYLPKNYSNEWNVSSPLDKFHLYDSNGNKLKIIFLSGDFVRREMPPGRTIFWQNKCPVTTCTFASTVQEVKNADAVIFKGKYVAGFEIIVPRRPHHVWILYLPESPLNSRKVPSLKHMMNWTASYRHDSEIVTPFGKFVPYTTTSLYTSEKTYTGERTLSNYAANKTKKVAWFVSDCDAKNNRLEYAVKLKLYIDIDIYGPCGTKSCPSLDECLELLDKDYKFYLSFENANCNEYITEVFFENGLGHNVLPIVMGARREDYEKVAPPHSFIHVKDFSSPRKLAQYLHELDADDSLYNEYFKWKGTGEFIDTRFWCRLCALLHSPREHRSYEDIQKWWSGPGVCGSRKV